MNDNDQKIEKPEQPTQVSDGPVQPAQPAVQPVSPVEAPVVQQPIENPVPPTPTPVPPVTAEPPKETKSSPMEEDANRDSKGPKGTITLILIFVLLFGFLFFLPKISEEMNLKEARKKLEDFDKELKELEEKEKEEQAQKQEEEKEVLVSCVSPSTLNAEGTMSIETTITLTASKDKLKEYKEVEKDTYTVVTPDFDTNLGLCQEKLQLFMQNPINGYEFSCEGGDNEIIKQNQFDLGEFKESSYAYSNGTTEVISSKYKSGDSLKNIREDLEAENYVCSEVTTEE